MVVALKLIDSYYFAVISTNTFFGQNVLSQCRQSNVHFSNHK